MHPDDCRPVADRVTGWLVHVHLQSHRLVLQVDGGTVSDVRRDCDGAEQLVAVAQRRAARRRDVGPVAGGDDHGQDREDGQDEVTTHSGILVRPSPHVKAPGPRTSCWLCTVQGAVAWSSPLTVGPNGLHGGGVNERQAAFRVIATPAPVAGTGAAAGTSKPAANTCRR